MEVDVLTNSNSVDHNGHFGDSPAHNQGTDREMVLEGSTNHDETANVQRYRDIACPNVRSSISSFAKV